MHGRILFITSRNVINTCGELRLIKNRTVTLFREWNIQTDFIVFSENNRKNKSKEEIGANSSMTICNYSKYNLIDGFRNLILLKKIARKKLEKNKYDAIILSGYFVLFFSRYFSTHFPDVEIVADIHGVYEELIEFKPKSYYRKFLNKLIYYLLIFEQKISLPYCDSAFVVSEALKEYILNRFHLNNLNFYVIPCSLRREEINIKDAEVSRHKWRKIFNIERDELLFIYSGGISTWQSIEEAITVFRILGEMMPERKMHFLIMSHNAEKLRYLESEKVMIKSFLPDEVKDVLFAGDFAFLLRGNFITNNVAFPNKFIEYVLSGMQLISTPYVFDIAKFILNYNLGFLLGSIDREDFSGLVLKGMMDRPYEINWADRFKLVEELCFEKTLSPFVARLDN